MQTPLPIRRALISVFDKAGILEFAQSLYQRGIQLLSTGGTARLLTEGRLVITKVSNYTGFPESWMGESKHCTLRCMAAFSDVVIMMTLLWRCQYGIEPIDIGGSAMVRSAAKNHKDLIIVVNNRDYPSIITEMDTHNGTFTLETRFNLAVKAFEYTAAYDSMIANYFSSQVADYHSNNQEPAGLFLRTLNLNFIKKQNMRYGENSHQLAAFYTDMQNQEASVSTAQQLQGKSLSYNNISDTNAALECVKTFAEPACIIVKHANPCGVATS